MSIPLDQLYNYIDNIVKEITDNIIIYRFYPHGTKKLENLKELAGPISWKEASVNIPLYCNDQEPLNYDLYQNVTPRGELQQLLESLSLFDKNCNLKFKTTIYNKVLLLHSEQRSDELIKYQNHQAIPIYYWSHAIIARDWFRFAQHCQQKKSVKKKFLVYNRAWAGTREYRLKFAELLIRLGVPNECRIGVNPIEPELGIHYKIHRFKNLTWRPNFPLENFFPISTAHSHCSADFDLADYEATDIEVVLETLFDDSRLHLTEKSLRPIALGQPFILAGTHGSLEYLRSYGFKTFMHIWDERYDMIEDPYERLGVIADLMKQIANWAPWIREQKLAEAQAIADYNKKHFFSKEFFNQVVTELKNNLQSGVIQLHNTNNFKPFIDRWEHFLTFKKISSFIKTNKDPVGPRIKQLEYVLKITKDLHQQQLNNQ